MKRSSKFFKYVLEPVQITFPNALLLCISAVPIASKYFAKPPKKLYPPWGPTQTPNEDWNLSVNSVDVYNSFGNLLLNSQKPVWFFVVPDSPGAFTPPISLL